MNRNRFKENWNRFKNRVIRQLQKLQIDSIFVRDTQISKKEKSASDVALDKAVRATKHLSDLHTLLNAFPKR